MTKRLKVRTFGEESLGSLLLGQSFASCGAAEIKDIFLSLFFHLFRKVKNI